MQPVDGPLAGQHGDPGPVHAPRPAGQGEGDPGDRHGHAVRRMGRLLAPADFVAVREEPELEGVGGGGRGRHLHLLERLEGERAVLDPESQAHRVHDLARQTAAVQDPGLGEQRVDTAAPVHRTLLDPAGHAAPVVRHADHRRGPVLRLVQIDEHRGDHRAQDHHAGDQAGVSPDHAHDVVQRDSVGLPPVGSRQLAVDSVTAAARGAPMRPGVPRFVHMS